MECPVCRLALPADARFCSRCGTAAAATQPEPPPDPLRETLKIALGQQYEVLHLLGRGGMGAVYLARETALEREVAIKILPPDHGTTQESRDRFRREARTAAKLSHPNIVPLYTFGDVDGTLFFVMGYVKGESLSAKLRRDGPLDPESARRLLIDLSSALEYAHTLGIVHRDIKPDNVLIDAETGRAMLTDFGVAKALGAGQTMTIEGSLLGTPHYMSPEQAQGRSDIDQRSDLYSLGVMAFAMLAGRLPFEGKTTADVLVQHITKEAPTLRSFVPNVPPEIAIAISRCLAKDPNARWSDAHAFRAALTVTEDDDLPPALEPLQRLALTTSACVLLAAYVNIWLWGAGADLLVPRYTVVVPLCIALCYLLMLAERVRTSRKEGFDFDRIRYEMLKQPRLWVGWYPRRFRVAGDVWDRLPHALRQTRSAMSSVFVVFFGCLLPAGILLVSDLARVTGAQPPLVRFVDHALMAANVLAVIALFYYDLRWQRRARELGVNIHLREQLSRTPAGKRSFWSKPEIAALLLPVSEATKRTMPSSAQELAAQISSIARAVPESARDAAKRAAATARELAAGIDAFDKELVACEGLASPGEAEHLSMKIAAASEHPELREVMQKQLDLIRSIEVRAAETRERRARRLELLRTLWQQAADLQASAGSVKAGRTSERILALCAEIDDQLSTATMATPAADPIFDLPTLKSP